MVFLQAILSLLSRSAGKIFGAMFGWAVSALFGPTVPRERARLSLVVGAAAFWPILLFGVIAPKVATTVLAFLPLSESVPTGPIRAVWIALALLLPMIIGSVVARRAPAHTPADTGLVKFLRGFQITLALAAAFLFVLVAAPIRKLVSVARGLRDEYLPLLAQPQEQPDTVRRIVRVLSQHGYSLQRQEPSWGMKAPGRILSTLGGGAFKHFAPQQIELFRTTGLEVVINPGGVTLRGKENTTAKAQGLIAEAMTESSALQATDPLAQAIEKQIKDVLKVYSERPDDHTGSRTLLARVAEISREIAKLPVAYDQWQIVYRQALQLSRALHGQGQLLDEHLPKENSMTTIPDETTRAELRPTSTLAEPEPELLHQVPLKTLLCRLTEGVKLLALKEAELAKAEIQSHIESSVSMVKSLSIAAVSALLGLNMLLVAGAFGLATMMPAWAAALALAVPLLIVGAVMGGVGWAKRVKNPLEATRASLKEDVQWMKNRLA